MTANNKGHKLYFIALSAALIVTALCMAGIVHAKEVPTSVSHSGIELVGVSDDNQISKYYDYDQGIVCYRTTTRPATSKFYPEGVAISCVKM